MVTKEGEQATTEGQAQAGQPASPETTPPAATTEPDYKAEIETYKTKAGALEEENRRLKTRLDGAQGTIHQRQDWEMVMRRNDQKISDLAEVVKSLVIAQTDDPEHPARKNLSALEARSEEERQQSLVEEGVREDWREILVLVAKAEGKPFVTDADVDALSATLQNDPAWREVDNLTQAGFGGGFGKRNPKSVRQAVHKARDIAGDKKEKAHKAELQAVEARVKQEAEVEKQKALAPFMKSPQPSAAGTGAKGRRPTPEEVAAASPLEYAQKVKSGEWDVGSTILR